MAGRKPPVPFAARVEREAETAVVELLLLVGHEPLCVGQLQHLCEERVAASLGTERTLHFASVEKLILGALFTVYRHVEEVHARGFGDDGIHDGAEAESRLTVAILHVRMQLVLQFGEVRVADLTALIVFVRVNDSLSLRHSHRSRVHIPLRPCRRTPRRFPFRP